MSRRYAVIVVVLLIGSLCFSQTPKTQTVHDATAMRVIATSLQAMGTPANFAAVDSVAVAQLAIGSEKAPSVTLNIETKGTDRIRIAKQDSSGSSTKIVNAGKAQVTKSDGSRSTTPLSQSLAERVPHVPALSLLAEGNDASVEALYEGTETVNGALCDVVSLSTPNVGDPKQADAFREVTKRKFYVDRASGFVAKFEYKAYGPPTSPGSSIIDVYYADYRNMQGIQVPFTQITMVNGEPLSKIAVTSIQFNVGVSDSDFVLEGAN